MRKGCPRGGEGRPLGIALEEVRRLGDFTTRPRVLLISAIAVLVGTGGPFGALFYKFRRGARGEVKS
ncbi:MAG: hypothetical protein KGL45_05380 [Gammaproteobacteria bacterium]|nr:hypothetical protein [Gammaproteobacteria bacterium]